MPKPERHTWEKGSTHRAVAGTEYDKVWDHVAELESKNAELKKYLKHARDDKKIRLGEIEVLEAIVEVAKEFRNAELKSASHQTTCKKGCDTFGESECEDFGSIWVEEQNKRKLFWKILRPKEASNENPQN